MRLADLQAQLFQTFQDILREGRLSHAYLFTGDFASLEMANYLAQSRFCLEPEDGFPCGRCRTCQLIRDGEFTDVKLIEPQGNIIKTDTIRELTREFSRSGYEGSSQVFIIKDAHKMHPNAANSLLKFIEEPQSATYVILLVPNETQVLETIRSRCQVFHFPKNAPYLQTYFEQRDILPNHARVLVALTTSLASAESLAGDKKVLDQIQACQNFLRQLKSTKDLAYLEVSRLASLLPEKQDQDLALHILMILLSQEGYGGSNLHYLDQLHEARQMWQANVSFQNALEYMVIN